MNRDKYCLCGCGVKILERPHHRYAGMPDYVRGHNKRSRFLEIEVDVRNVLERTRKHYDDKRFQLNMWMYCSGAVHAVDQVEALLTGTKKQISRRKGYVGALSEAVEMKFKDVIKYNGGGEWHKGAADCLNDLRQEVQKMRKEKS